MSENVCGQLIMPRIDFTEEDCLDDAIRLVREFNVYGFIVFNGEMEQVREALSELQSHSKHRLLIGCDAERGLGQIVKGGTLFPFLMSQGAADDPLLVRQQAEITASEMKYCGFNILFAPVMDVNTNPDNPIINVRSFSDDKEKVSRLGREFIKRMQSLGVAACGKHFPGHGDCNTDSHVSMPQVTRTEQQLYSEEISPFREAVSAGVLSLMLAHVNYRAFDSDHIPATFSEYIIKKILRQDIGYDGLIISDSFTMGALRVFGDENEVALRTLKAGCNIILDPVDPFSLITYLDQKFVNDSEFAETVKEHYGILRRFRDRCMSFPEQPVIFTNMEKNKVVNGICERSVCRIRGEVLDADKVDILIVDIAGKGETAADTLKNELIKSGVGIGKSGYVAPGVYPRNLYGPSDTPLLITVFTSVRAWKEYSVIPEDLKHSLNELVNKRHNSILLCFGSPYVVKSFTGVGTVLLSFDSLPECQSSMVSVLTGETDARGVLPVKI